MKKGSVILLIMITLFACKKDVRDTGTLRNGASMRDSLQLDDVKNVVKAVSEVNDIAGQGQFKLADLPIDWDRAISYKGHRSNYWLVPLSGQPDVNGIKQGFRKLAFLKDDQGQTQMRILEFVPDVLYWQRKGRVSTLDYTGYIYVFDASYKFISGKIYSGGRQIGESKPGPHPVRSGSELHTQQVSVVADCYWHDSNYLDAEGHVVIHSDRICSYTVYDDGWYPGEGNDSGPSRPPGDPIGEGGGGGPVPVPPPPAPSNLPYEDQDEIDAKDYVRCFGNLSNTGATMSVTLYVQQPFPGTVFNVGPNSVGHVALGLTKTNGSTSIRQTLGFYPDATGKDKFRAPSKVIDNGGIMDYNLSITYNVTATQFQAILDYVNTPPANYDIVESNCTTFAIHALANGGVMAPDAYSVVGMNGIGGAQSAMTPAGLGNSISQMQGKPGVNTSGGAVPSSKGPCK